MFLRLIAAFCNNLAPLHKSHYHLGPYIETLAAAENAVVTPDLERRPS